jgi:hypothetical protein
LGIGVEGNDVCTGVAAQGGKAEKSKSKGKGPQSVDKTRRISAGARGRVVAARKHGLWPRVERKHPREERELFGTFENLFAKYSTSADTMETARHKTQDELQGILCKLGY